MNERIQELIEQARKEELGNEFPQDVYEQEAVQQRLVQLVVRECIACVTRVGQVNTAPVEPINTAHAIKMRIKQHFGVEL